MSENRRIPQVIRPDLLTQETAQTLNLHRFVAIDPEAMEMEGSAKIFFGRATTPSHASSGAHHHGEAETAGYVISGRCRIYFGEGYKEFVECHPGDFMYVPPNCPHIEANIGDEPFIGIVARSPGNIVHNLDETDVPVHLQRTDPR